MRSTGLHRLKSTTDPLPPPIADGPVAGFCGIGNPSSFRRQLEGAGFHVGLWQEYRDHHQYAQAEITALEQRAVRAGAKSLITTAKDAVKLRDLRFELPCLTLEIEIQIEPEEELLKLIAAALSPR